MSDGADERLEWRYTADSIDCLVNYNCNNCTRHLRLDFCNHAARLCSRKRFAVGSGDDDGYADTCCCSNNLSTESLP